MPRRIIGMRQAVSEKIWPLRHRVRSLAIALIPGGHSTNVTLLISRSVVTPVMSASTADWRRNRIPSSRAAFLISEVGRLSRISSRMRSVRSSSSQIAMRPL
jgi:hypothetical protein